MEIRKGGSNLLDRLFHAFRPSHLWMRMIYPSGGKHFISPFHVSCIPHFYVAPHKGFIRLTIHTFSLRKRFSLFFLQAYHCFCGSGKAYGTIRQIILAKGNKYRLKKGLSHPEGKFVMDDVTSLQGPPKPHEME
jgi:hypothetical protein